MARKVEATKKGGFASNSSLGRKVETTKKGRFTIEKFISNSTSKPKGTSTPFNAREIAKLNKTIKMICELKQMLSKYSKFECEH